ncbi:MAG: methyltransferase domain-containing protein [Cyanobacteriota bacterium]|nr:methyltransferase domain-containing protein [Cyanobacteriota bacterium]
MTDTLTKFAYQTFQQSKNYFSLAHKLASNRFARVVAPAFTEGSKALPPELLLDIQQRLEKLLEVDWRDAERDIYPTDALFDNPWDDFWRYYPSLWFDMPQVWERANSKQYQTFSTGIETEGYPSYYVQNFHHQTDGYLSDFSANLYDLQVDILFNGTADAMRRRILAPLKQGLAGFEGIPEREIRLLDVATGTGRTLRLIRTMLPKASLFGIDLSAAYLRKANQLLSELPGELPQLCQANAEQLPYLDDYFHGVTCVFTFHELPPEAREHAIAQCYRVTKPGGVFVICDSIQSLDSPELAPVLENFHQTFHEPYYRHYITDDLGVRLERVGFTDIRTENHFMSKYWIARKPN